VCREYNPGFRESYPGRDLKAVLSDFESRGWFDGWKINAGDSVMLALRPFTGGSVTHLWSIVVTPFTKLRTCRGYPTREAELVGERVLAAEQR